MSQKTGMFEQCGFYSDVSQCNQASAGSVKYWEVGEYAELSRQLESFLDSVLKTNQIPFDVRRQWGRELVVRNPVGASGYRSLVGYLPQCGRWMDLFWPGYAYRADWQLFFDCFQQHPFSTVCGYGAPTRIFGKAHAAERYNDFIGFLRVEAVRRRVRKALADGRANLHDQSDSLACYLSELTSRFKHLVPIRVDKHYAEDAFDDSDAMPRMGWAVTEGGVWMPVASQMPVIDGRPETRARIDTAMAMTHRDSFFSNRRGADKHLFDRMVGHVSKLERGGRNGANHFHCVFLLDATGLTQVDILAIKWGLGERWRRVTHGLGMMFDCHDVAYRRSIESRVQWAIDPLDCSNTVQVARFIDYIVGYFTKDDDQMVPVKPTARANTLTKGR